MSSITPEQFPDIHHLIHLRDRLWARRPRGRAAVMVGAGFSLNAESQVAGSTSFPLWSDLTGRMLDELRPLLSVKEREKEVLKYASGSGSLTLAREYELAFGRSSLDELILTLVPDRNFSPGELHHALLALPWADVFTTNYDTLLERTPPGEEGRYYDVVVQPSDLPISTPPRIVKLHGSLPATKPFIITDEDFRRYPHDFAPFVNTVQQSMMENDFVLLGFSGDDPNFLAWLGWVRDELQVHRARVYLCGVLDMPTARRLLLHERGVTVIDLGPLFPAKNLTRSQRNRQALAWLLASLHNGQVLEPALDWPLQPAAQGAAVPAGTRAPLVALTQTYPPVITRFTQVPNPPPGQAAAEYTKEAQAEIGQVLTDWQREREEYPGWLTLPRRNRQFLLERTEKLRWPLVQWMTTLPVADRLRPLAELIWRLDKSVQLLYDVEYKLLQRVLDEVPLPHDPAQQEQWATVAFKLLKELRRSYDSPTFATLLERLEPLSQCQPRYAAWRCWQAALECLEHLNQPGARRWLKQWPDVPTDPVWNLRRAGLWAELNELETAERYARAALHAALQLQPRLTIRIDMLAVEAAARMLLRTIQGEQRWQDTTTPFFLRRPPRTRGELARHKLYMEYRCDVVADTDMAATELGQEEPALQQSIYDSVNPYTGIRVRHRTSRSGLDLTVYQPAFDIVDAQEQLGQPFRLANTRYERLEAVGNRLLTVALPRTLALMARGDDEALLQRIDKAALATLEPSELLPLLEQTIVIGEEFFPQTGSRPPAGGPGTSYSRRHGRLALRLLGRAAFRLDAPLRERAVRLAWVVWEQWFESVVTQREQFEDFTAGMTNVLEPAELLAHLPLLLTAAAEPEYTSGALENVPRELLPAVRPATREFKQAVRTCLAWLSKPPGSGERRVSLRRLLLLHELNWLTPPELAALSRNLWAPVAATRELPALGDDLQAWTVLLLPPNAATDAPGRLKEYLVAQLDGLSGANSTSAENQPKVPVHLSQLLVDLINATQPATGSLANAPFAGRRQWLDWAPEEALRLLNWAEQFLQSQLPKAQAALRARQGEPVDWMDSADECRYLWHVLAQVVLPALSPDDPTAVSRVYACARQLLAAELPARVLLPLLLPQLPQQLSVSTVATTLRLALLHATDADIVEDSAAALCRWAYAAEQNALPPLPESLFSEFVLRTGMPTLPGQLEVLAWTTNLLAHAPQLFWPGQVPALGNSLAVLLAETEPPTWRERNLARQVTERVRLFQRPQVRVEAARLAGQLAWLQTQQTVAEPAFVEILTGWTTAASQDYLPEVRRAWHTGYEDAVLRASWAAHANPQNK
jgi:hypothetical protein